MRGLGSSMRSLAGAKTSQAASSAELEGYGACNRSQQSRKVPSGFAAARPKE